MVAIGIKRPFFLVISQKAVRQRQRQRKEEKEKERKRSRWLFWAGYGCLNKCRLGWAFLNLE